MNKKFFHQYIALLALAGLLTTGLAAARDGSHPRMANVHHARKQGEEKTPVAERQQQVPRHRSFLKGRQNEHK